MSLETFIQNLCSCTNRSALALDRTTSYSRQEVAGRVGEGGGTATAAAEATNMRWTATLTGSWWGETAVW